MIEAMSSTSQTSNVSPNVDIDTDSEGVSRAMNTGKKRRRSALACQRCKSRKQKCLLNPSDETKPCRRCEEAEAICSFTLPSPATPEDEPPSAHVQAQINALRERLREYNPNDELLLSPVSTFSAELPQASSSRPPPPAKPATKTGDTDARGEDGRGDDDMAAGVALLSLDSANELKYLRPSFGYFWTKLVSGSFKGPPSPLCASEGPVQLHGYSGPRSSGVPLPDSKTALALLDACYRHLQARYACLDWITVRNWVINQESTVIRDWSDPLDIEANRRKGTSSFFVWMIYAIGSRLLQGRPTPGLNIGDPKQYHAEALQHLDVVVRLHNVNNVQAYILLVIYSIWSTEGPSAWYLVGMAMRIAIEIGMHRRRAKPKGVKRYSEEVRKRTWWGLYCMDRWLSLTLGRPVSISDSDIDQELPWNVACDIDLPEEMPRTAKLPLSSQTFTSMSSAIQMIRLRQIDSEILQAVHSVKAQVHNGLQQQHLRILDKLDQWKNSIVLPNSVSDANTLPCLSKKYYELKAETAKLQLLRPLLVSAKAGDMVLMMTGTSAAEVCQLDRSILQLYPQYNSLCFSDLHGIFLTGLTLLRVLWIDPNTLHSSTAHKAVRACSTSLFTYAQHFQEAAPYRDAFEELASICLDNRAGAPDPTNYRSASTLAGALNRLDQEFIEYEPSGIGNTQHTQAESRPEISGSHMPDGLRFTTGERLEDSSWPDADSMSGLLYNFDGLHGASDVNGHSTGQMPDLSQNDMLLPSMAYPQASSISDLFNQLLGASTPWQVTDDSSSLSEMINGQTMPQTLSQTGTNFFGDTNWNLDQ